MFVTRENYKAGLRVKINPSSMYALQMVGAAYGLTEELNSSDWCNVRWYDKKNSARNHNFYRISLDANKYDKENRVYDLILDRKEQLEFEF